MGQQTSKELEREKAGRQELERAEARLQELEEARRQELDAMRIKIRCLQAGSLGRQRVAERRAGILAAPGSAQALYNAANAHCDRLFDEMDGITNRQIARKLQLLGRSLPMTDPPPPCCVPPLPPPPPPSDAAQPPAPACGMDPDTPMGDASLRQGQRGSSSSSEEGGHASLRQGQRGSSCSSEEGGHTSGGECGADVPLPGVGGSGRLAQGLRRRQHHGNQVEHSTLSSPSPT